MQRHRFQGRCLGSGSGEEPCRQYFFQPCKRIKEGAQQVLVCMTIQPTTTVAKKNQLVWKQHEHCTESPWSPTAHLCWWKRNLQWRSAESGSLLCSIQSQRTNCEPAIWLFLTVWTIMRSSEKIRVMGWCFHGKFKWEHHKEGNDWIMQLRFLTVLGQRHVPRIRLPSEAKHAASDWSPAGCLAQGTPSWVGQRRRAVDTVLSRFPKSWKFLKFWGRVRKDWIVKFPRRNQPVI